MTTRGAARYGLKLEPGWERIVERDRLAGVADMVALPFGHVNCTGSADCGAARQLQDELLTRLQ